MNVREALRVLAFDAVRAFVYGLIIILIIIVFDSFYKGQQVRSLEDINNGTRATACILALPITDAGRSQQSVENCLAVNGLEP